MRAQERNDDRGFAIILMAFVLVALLGAVTVAVDLGSRYALAAKIQRAADAAALAGVTLLPNGLGQAEAEARQVAARNGYAHDPDGSGVTVTVSEIGPETLQVEIELAEVPEYFGVLFEGPDSVTRRSTAKFVRSVSLGSPRNFLGTGDLLGSDSGGDMWRLRRQTGQPDLSRNDTEGLRENSWLAISGECTSKENGDRYNAVSTANYDDGGWDRCEGGGTIVNDEFRGHGYIYAVSIPPGYAAGPIEIQAFDPAICNGSRPDDPNDASSRGMTTTYTIRSGSTDPLGGTVVSNDAFPRSSNGCSEWEVLHRLDSPVENSTYFIQVDAGRNDERTFSVQSNGFALRADVMNRRSDARFWGCSSDPVETSIYAADCPQVYAVGDMGVFASLDGEKAEFFLAQIDSEYDGKELQVTLFDPGEGAETLRIKNPAGDYEAFDWEVDCGPGITPPTGDCTGSASASGGLDLVGESSNPQPGPRRLGRSKYNDRALTLSIDLPADIADAYGGATWWKVEYEVGSSPTDRTTWAVEVKGDPVRLLPNP